MNGTITWNDLYENIQTNDVRAIARGISLIENEAEGYLKFLENASFNSTKIIGITGPPGAGKSSITDKMISAFVAQNLKIAVLCIDPSSPFNLGALLGDRLRMSAWYLHPQVYIRSLASRGALGGLNAKIMEITDLIKIANFDIIIIETVGVGQSEIDIVGIADTTIVVLVPESGDEIQTMKAGLMEIADIFVVNKCDRPDADVFYHYLKLKLAPTFASHKHVDIVKTIATKNDGINELIVSINKHNTLQNKEIKYWNLVNKAFELIQKHRMKNVYKNDLFKNIKQQYEEGSFHLYQFMKSYIN